MKIDWGKKLFLLLIRGTFLVFPFQKQLTAHSALYVHIICYLQSAGFIICRAGQKHLYFFISSVQIFLAPLCMLKTCIFSLWMQISPPPFEYQLQFTRKGNSFIIFCSTQAKWNFFLFLPLIFCLFVRFSSSFPVKNDDLRKRWRRCRKNKETFKTLFKERKEAIDNNHRFGRFQQKNKRFLFLAATKLGNRKKLLFIATETKTVLFCYTYSVTRFMGQTTIAWVT